MAGFFLSFSNRLKWCCLSWVSPPLCISWVHGLWDSDDSEGLVVTKWHQATRSCKWPETCSSHNTYSLQNRAKILVWGHRTYSEPCAVFKSFRPNVPTHDHIDNKATRHDHLSQRWGHAHTPRANPWPRGAHNLVWSGTISLIRSKCVLRYIMGH